MNSNTYYIFVPEDKPVKLAPGCAIIQVYHVFLSTEQVNRLFQKSNLTGKPFSIYKIQPSKQNLGAAIENGKYHNDCNLQIHELLTTNKTILGYSSQHINRILSTIIQYDENSNTICLMGENGWSSLREFFKALNDAQLSYVILRKYEMLPESFIDGDHDIDLLCDSKEEMILAAGAKKRSIGISAYYITINNTKTDLDIRYVGDNYLDKMWAKNILDNRRLNESNIYVMDTENQLFTILYHCLTQKQTISNYYRNIIQKLIKEITKKHPLNKESLIKLLASFMKSKVYAYERPMDISVIQNRINIELLKRNLKTTSRKNDFIRTVYIKSPYPLRKLIPSKVKKRLFKTID